VAVFIPLATVQGISGQMFEPMGFSIVFALCASLFSAVTLVPLFFVQFKPVEQKRALGALIFKKMERSYARLLRKILGRKKTVLAVTLAFMALSIFLASFIRFELMPSIDEGIISISVQTRPGLKLENVNAIMTELEEMAAYHPDVERYSLSSGGGGFFGGGGSRLTAYLYKNRKMSTDEVIEQWRHETRYILDCDIDISSSASQNMGMMGGSNIDIVLLGESLDRTKEAAAMIEGIMAEHPDIIRVSSSIDRASPQAEIVIDPLKAAAKNLTPQMVTASIFTALNGANPSDIRIDGQSYAIRVEYPRGRYESVSDVADMIVISPAGVSVPLMEIASVAFTDTPQTIVREEGQYVVTVTGTPVQAARFTARDDIELAARGLSLPGGVSLGQSTEMEMMNEEFTSLGMAIITAILLVFMVMAIQFESVRHSLMVMTCIPFAAIGSFGLMFFTGTTISMVSLLGFLVLVGLVVNNGILFVDTTNKYRQTMELRKALIRAGRTRLRPILMITLTTVLALMPLGLGIGHGGEIMQGLGVTVIGGLTASTILALLLLPTFYLIIDGNPEKRAERKRRRSERLEARKLR